jgi:cell wall-associated NlpC family hydrolase
MSTIDDITSRISALEQMFPALSPAAGADDSDSVSSAGAPVTTTADGSGPLTVFDSELQSALAAEADQVDSTGHVEIPASPATSDSSAGGTESAAIGTAGTTGTTGSAVVADAEKYIGVPYVYGGTNPATGLDCSALVQRAYADLGITLPRTSQEQSTMGTAVASLAQAQPGDLLGFDGTPPTHTGIYIGNNQMVVAPHTGEKVQIQTVSKTPTTIRRIIGTAADTTVATSSSAASALVSRPAALGGLGSTPATVTNPAGAATYATQFAAAEQKYSLPSGLLSAVAHAESDYQSGAVSSAGAIGLMQLMPATASALGVDPTDPSQAIDGAAKLLQGEIAKYNSVPLALAAYNAGGPAVDKYDGIPPYPETQSYVQKVMGYLNGDA